MPAHKDSTEVHVPYAWSYPDETEREAAAGLVAGDVGKLARQLDDNTLWMLTDDSPVTWVQVGSSSGSSAPVDAEYITSAANGTLSAEVVIPGLAGDPDIAGAGGAGTSEEYDTSTTGITWSPSTPATVNSDTTIKSHLYISAAPGTEYLGTKSWSPAGAFDARVKVSLGSTTPQTDGAYTGLIIYSSDNSAGLLLQINIGSTAGKYSITAFTRASSSFTQRGTTIVHVPDEVYLRLVRDGSNNCSFYWSISGKTWNLIATQSHTFTVAKIGYRVSNATATSESAIDWLRTSV